jgi:hypothetical protein
MTTESLVLEMKAKADQLKSELDAVEKKIKSAETSTEDLNTEFKATEKTSKELAAQINATKNKMTELTEKSNKLKGELFKANKELKQAKDEAKKLGDTSSETKSKISALTSTSKKLKDEMDDVGEEMRLTRLESEKLEKQAKENEDSFDGLSGKVKGTAKAVVTVTAAVVAGTTAFIAYAAAQGRAMQETEALATAAGMSIEKFKTMSFALGTVGLSAEKFGDIAKDTQERIGEFSNIGTGAFQDFVETMGMTREEGVKLAKEFQNLSGQEVLQEMVTRLEGAGKSGQEMSAVLEAMASDTTRLLPLLRNGGKAFAELNDKASKFNVELSEEERKQFKELAENVDLAQAAFFNWINNGIAPFLPLINKAGIALAEFFASQQSGSDLDDIYNNTDLIKQVKTLTQLGHLEQRLGKERQDLTEKMMVARERGTLGGFSKSFEEERTRLNELSKVILDQRKAIEERNAEAEKPPEIKTGNLGAETGQPQSATGGTETTGGTGLDLSTLKEELTAYENQAQSKLEILGNQRDKEMAIAGQLAQGSQERTDLERRIIEKYNSDVQALTDQENAMREKSRKKAVQGIQDDLKAVEDASRTKLEKLEDEESQKLEILKNNAQSQEEFNTLKLEIEQSYQDARRELIKAQDQETFDDEEVQANYNKELEKYQEMLAQKEISEQEYQERVKSLRTISGIQEDLAGFEESKKNRMDLLAEEEQEKLDLLADSNASAEEQAALKLEIERAYQEKRRELINEISPETYDNEVVQERYNAELEKLQEHLNNKLITEEDYYNKVDSLKKKSAKDEKKIKDQTVKWEGTATKKQIDQGIQLLDAVGGNSKKLFKVKQGLSAASAVMNTSEGVTKALASQNYVGAAVTAATGIAQLAAILSASPDGGGGGNIAPISGSSPTSNTGSTFTGEPTSTTVTDITEIDGSQQSTERFIIEFSDDVVDAVARKVKQSENDGRV